MRKSSNARKILVVTFLSGLVVVAIGTSAYMRLVPASTPHYFSAAQVASADFPLYYPTKLPSHFHATDTSGETAPDQKNTYILIFFGPKNAKLYMSQQGRVSTFDYGGFFKKITDERTAHTPLGELVYGYTNNSHDMAIASLVTKRTWIIVNSDTVTPTTLKIMLSNLEEYR